jgi:CBS domain-containing protein
LPRVYFGSSWLEGPPSEIWKNEIVRFPVLLRREMDVDPIESLKQGIIPKLNGIRLHNGTTYTWNRLCYGIENNVPHIRIECRYLPAGPSPIDEIANFAFWIGLMKGHSPDQFDFHKKINFRVVKDNFIRAARYGLESVFNWKGQRISANSLILEKLLPIAHIGLVKSGVNDEDRIKYLGIIQNRVEKMRSGSIWQVLNYRNLRTAYNTSHASKILVLESLPLQEENIPVSDWPDLTKSNILSTYTKPKDDDELVEDIMIREVISIKENTDADVALQVMQWKGFHHIPVESINGYLVGLASENLLNQHDTTQGRPIKEFMIKDVLSLHPEDTIAMAKEKLNKCKVSCLPVIENGILVGIITSTDLL